MKKTKIGIFLVSLLVISIVASVFVLAKPDVMPDKANAPFVIPAHAVEVAPGVFSLGTATDVDGRVVEGYLFVRDRRENAKPPWAGKGKGGGEKCYAFLAKGARWKTTEQYITGAEIDATLTQTSLDTWNAESPGIFGARNASGVVDGADDVSPDDKNEVEFADLGKTNTIAYAIVWGIFSGPPRGRELVEWDVIFNSDYAFGDADVSGNSVMDYQNIATHEFGHAVGLGHPDNSCAEETMYAYANYGETKKRDLNTGDIAGIQKLYS